MSNQHDDNEVRRYVEAFADGELDVEQSLRLLERMAMDPNTTKRVLHQQQLRQRTAKAMSAPERAPDGLREKLEKMAQDTPAPGEAVSQRAPRRGRRGVVAQIGRWAPAAAAAVLLITTISIIGVNQSPVTPGQRAGTVLTQSQVMQFERRHVRCAQGVSSLMNAERFPRQVTRLPGALRDYFDRSMGAPPLDLSALGYEYVQTGECHVPGEGAVHLVYRAAERTGRSDRVSLWIRPDDGRLKLDRDHMYVAADEQSPHPLLIWKQNGMVYYLAGDALDRVQRVAAHLRGDDGAHG